MRSCTNYVRLEKKRTLKSLKINDLRVCYLYSHSVLWILLVAQCVANAIVILFDTRILRLFLWLFDGVVAF